MRSLVILLALLFDWRLMHSMPEPRTYTDALAWCHLTGQLDALAKAISTNTRTCASLLAAQYGHPNELQTMVAAAMQWLVDFARLLTAGH